jgi:hypothetical protein
MLEVDESEYDETGIRLEKPPTIKKRKKLSLSRKITASEDVQELLNAQLHNAASGTTPESQAKTSAKLGFGLPMNCRTM